jgi:hypothetical protein
MEEIELKYVFEPHNHNQKMFGIYLDKNLVVDKYEIVVNPDIGNFNYTLVSDFTNKGIREVLYNIPQQAVNLFHINDAKIHVIAHLNDGSTKLSDTIDMSKMAQ